MNCNEKYKKLMTERNKTEPDACSECIFLLVLLEQFSEQFFFRTERERSDHVSLNQSPSVQVNQSMKKENKNRTSSSLF